MMITCDKRESCSTGKGKDTITPKLQEEKLKSWKEFCSHTTDSKPWNAVYKLESGKQQSKTTFSNHKTHNGTCTTDIVRTMKHTMEYFIPEDESSDSTHHKSIRQLAVEPIDTLDDVEFTKEEMLEVLEKFDPRKTPGEDGIPTFFAEVYNECLRKGYFPKHWKRSIIIPIVKPGKEGSTEQISAY
jgi:hypothetical protein